MSWWLRGRCTVEVGGKRRVRPRENGGRDRREGIGKGLEDKMSVLRCLKGCRVVCGRVGSGGKVTFENESEISSGVAGGGGSEVGLVSNERSVVMDVEVRRLAYLWRAHLRALSRASSLNGLRVMVSSFWIFV